MNTALQDVIQREITVKAPKERVFQAIADPEQIVKWFPEGLEGKFEVGESPFLVFDGYGSYQILITAIQPFDYFAYRWVSNNEDGNNGFAGDVLANPNTLVEFHLSDVVDGTIVQVVESGFASLPESVRSKTILDNTEGWDEMLGRLEKLMSNQ